MLNAWNHIQVTFSHQEMFFHPLCHLILRVTLFNNTHYVTGPRYWVQWRGLEGSNRESFLAEQQAPGGVQAILDWEYQHGPIPELNITQGDTHFQRSRHREKVSEYKYKVYR